MNINDSKINFLEKLVEKFKDRKSLLEKIAVLDEYLVDQNSAAKVEDWMELLHINEPVQEYILKVIISLDQEDMILQGVSTKDHFNTLTEGLWDVEQFYHFLGGLIGYYLLTLKLLESEEIQTEKDVLYHKPMGYSINSDEVNHYIRYGLENFSQMAEIYPVGGAGDRLNLKDDITGESLPAAQLNFMGHTLLEGLIRDLQAREYLYYKIFQEQISIPVVMMTSHEKKNHQHILNICHNHHWFGRSEEAFFLMEQPLVPVITERGDWSLKAPLELNWKPGGHGVIWKLARDSGAFGWLSEHHSTKTLIRQINNPVAGTDNGLLAFIGIGMKHHYVFGFASCPRAVNTAEGMIVLVEKNQRFWLSNIEYTAFAQKGLTDEPEEPGSPYSKFPANTNVLFTDLQTIKETVEKCPLPGAMINFKNKITSINANGKKEEVRAGRLESMMQNISDQIVDASTQHLRSYVTYNNRRKTISVTKRSYEPGKSILETPEGAYYEILNNHRDLFANDCRMHIPKLCSEKQYIEHGPNIIIHYLPALGPSYSIIAQKIRGGVLHDQSEIQLEITELDIENLDLNGSLCIQATAPLGEINSKGILEYSEISGKCTLKDVEVRNAGINRNNGNVYWQNTIDRKECLNIILHGNAEFFAENVTFSGNYLIEVPDGVKWTAIERDGEITFRKEKIDCPTWHWKYSFGIDDRIVLKKAV